MLFRSRAIAATRANQSQLGAIMLAILGRRPRRPPMFPGGGATITSDSYVTADFIDKDGVGHRGAFVCDIADLVRNFRELADHLKLTDEERTEMFSELRKWIRRDYRAVQAPLA